MGTSPTSEAAQHWVTTRKYTKVQEYGPVALWQHRNRVLYAVTYDCQWDIALDYEEACSKLGEALMHHLTCEGLLD